MKPSLYSRVFISAAAALFITACSQAPKSEAPAAKSETPEVAGERYMRSMSDTLAAARAFSFDSSETTAFNGPNGEPRLLTFNRKTTVRRPNGLFFELHGKGDSTLDITAYYDGKKASLSSGADKTWTQTDVPASLDEMLDDVARRFGLPVPIADVVYSSPRDAFIGPSSKGGVVGQETIDGVACVKLDYDDEYVDVKLWVPATGQALPKRLELAYKKTPGRKSTIDFSNWNLNATVADATFGFSAPEGFRKIEFKTFVAKVAAGGKPSAQIAVATKAPATN